jgi:predicted DsbA family dithiol-disulfide isomerase
VCPWCAIGFFRLKKVIETEGFGDDVSLHPRPFELNPKLSLEGELLSEHLSAKYESTEEQSAEVRARIKELGAQYDFTFNIGPEMRIQNTFLAHQLLHLANEEGKSLEVKELLFRAYFTDGKDISDAKVLAECAGKAGMDKAVVAKQLGTDELIESVREDEMKWLEQDVRSVPALFVGKKIRLTGAQPEEVLLRALDEANLESWA